MSSQLSECTVTEATSPWSATELNETRTSAWTNTATEKVYMAKLAVVTSVPKMRITHWPFSFCSVALISKLVAEATRLVPSFDAAFAIQGVILSDQRTPRSRANCSNVTGKKEPTLVSDCSGSGFSEAISTAYRLHIRHRPRRRGQRNTIPRALLRSWD